MSRSAALTLVSTEQVAPASRLRPAPLPLPTQRGLNREAAAAYIGISASLFDELVRDGRMPAPKRINARTVWDRAKLDLAFDALPGDEGFLGGNDEDWSVEP